MKNFFKPYAAALISALLVSLICLQSCKKTPTPPPPPPPPPPPNYLCDGNGQTNYMPLKKGNKWEYNSTGFMDHTEEVTDTATIDGKLYHEVTYATQIGSHDEHYRMDANGNIYLYNTVDSKEYLYLPANPTVGQVIATFVSGEYFKVVSVSATYTSPDCSYSGLLKIEDVYSGSPSEFLYYKKGIGLVGRMGSFGNTDDLDAVTFK